MKTACKVGKGNASFSTVNSCQGPPSVRPLSASPQLNSAAYPHYLSGFKSLRLLRHSATSSVGRRERGFCVVFVSAGDEGAALDCGVKPWRQATCVMNPGPSHCESHGYLIIPAAQCASRTEKAPLLSSPGPPARQTEKSTVCLGTLLHSCHNSTVNMNTAMT